jgi:NifU-like protein involved in Fe-S cluster formation
MAGAAVLYTPEVLGLATALSNYPWDEALPLHGDARSKSCGSTIALGLSTDADGKIDRIAIKSSACAIGQAAAAIFAAAATGRNAADIAFAERSISAWLNENGPLPDWPEIDAIAAARDYPGRHGAILLAWRAASDLLPSD